jgi:hypothetical protein
VWGTGYFDFRSCVGGKTALGVERSGNGFCLSVEHLSQLFLRFGLLPEGFYAYLLLRELLFKRDSLTRYGTDVHLSSPFSVSIYKLTIYDRNSKRE